MNFAFFDIMYRYLIVFYLIFISLHAQGVEVKDLYQAKVPVENQTRQARNQAINQAFKIVLVKVGGREAVLNELIIKSSLNQHQQFVVAFRYEKNDNQLNLVATFDEQKVNQLFTDGQLAIWGSLRPQVVMWIVEEQGLLRRVLSDTQSHPLISAVKKFATDRGVPITLPLMDLTDNQNITVSDIWGRFSTSVNNASQRYQAEAIVVVRAAEINDNAITPSTINPSKCEPICKKKYQLDWQFIGEEGTELIGNQYQGSQLVELMNQAMIDLTDVIYQDYAINVNVEQRILVNVASANAMRDTLRVSEYLSNLSVVQSVTLVRATANIRQFQLDLRGSKAAFIASLALDNALQQRLDPLAPVDPDAIPVLYWSQP